MSNSMRKNSSLLPLLCATTLFSCVATQALVPLGGFCKNSVQCVGVSICHHNECACPAGYMNVRSTCVFQNVAISGPGYTVPATPNTIPNRNPNPISPTSQSRQPSTQIISYPGKACAAGVRCVGGSYCTNGLCTCPNGYIVQSLTCVPAPSNYPRTLPQVFQAQLPPYSSYPVDSRPLSQPVIPRPGSFAYPGDSCISNEICVGGSTCSQGRCVCPRGLVIQDRNCVYPPPSTSIQAPAPNPNGYYPSQGSGPYPGLSVQPGPFPPLGEVPTYAYPGTPCTNQMVCTGGSYCDQGTCRCPSGYVISGPSCVRGGESAHTSSSVNHQPAPPVETVPYAYPGTPCSVGVYCLGGSFCYEGTCGCPDGYIISAHACVPGPGSYPPEPPPTFLGASVGRNPALPSPPKIPSPTTCPAGQIFLGSNCVPQSYLSKYPPGMLCFNTPCTGGSFCMNGLCTCPTGVIWSAGNCVQNPETIKPYSSPFRGREEKTPRRARTTPSAIGPGGSCLRTSQCVTGAHCKEGNCDCAQELYAYGTVCVRRKTLTTVKAKVRKSKK